MQWLCFGSIVLPLTFTFLGEKIMFREKAYTSSVNAISFVSFLIYVSLFLLLLAYPVCAMITTQGEVFPASNPADWSMSNYCIIGYHVDGAVRVDNGSGVEVYQTIMANDAGTRGTVNIDGAGSTWNTLNFFVGTGGDGFLNITGGASATTTNNDIISSNDGSTGLATVSGIGSTWTSSASIIMGNAANSDGTLRVFNGATINVRSIYIANIAGSRGRVIVSGQGSSLVVGKSISTPRDIYIGASGTGILDIFNHGLVSADRYLIIDNAANGNSSIYMASGGMLAIYDSGWTSGDGLSDFLELVGGTDAINYWDGVAWSDITSASYGSDYTLAHISDGGDLDGYTVLTVNTFYPDPDINEDGKVDLEDFAILADQWQVTTCAGPNWCDRADIDQSGDVSILDLQILAQHWLEG